MSALRCFALVACVAAATDNPAHAQSFPGARVASINLCTDQHLLALGAPSQIAGLSPYARDAAQSWLAREAQRYPLLSGTAEDVLALAPDLVVAGRFSRRQTRELLRARGVRVEEFDAVDTIEEVKRQILRFGALIGRSDAAAAQVAAIDAAVTRARAVAARSSLTALPLQRRGWVSGERSLMTSLLQTVGLRNAAAEAGVRDVGLMSLEQIVALQPDLLLVSRADSRAEDQGRALLLHPAVARRYSPERMLVLPDNLTVCGGGALVEALDRLAAQVARLGR